MEFFEKWSVYFIDRLKSDFDLDFLSAAAIVGNAGHESNGFKSLQELKPLVPGSRGGYGIMQWTGPRRRDYEAYCSRNSLNPADMETNYKFLFVELKGPEGKILTPLRAAKTLDEKVYVFMKGFLRPGIPHLDSRRVWALRAVEAYQKSSAPVDYEVQPVDKKPSVEAPRVKQKWWEILLEILMKLLRR